MEITDANVILIQLYEYHCQDLRYSATSIVRYSILLLSFIIIITITINNAAWTVACSALVLYEILLLEPLTWPTGAESDQIILPLHIILVQM